MVQMGLDTPVFGVLMGDTCVPDGDVVDMTQLIHPKVEAEIAFVTSRELSGDVSIDEVLAATEFVLPAIEVIDSRFKDFKFDIQSVVADNTSAARYVVGGSPRRPDGLDLRLLGVVMERNGEVVGTAAGAAVMGHPGGVRGRVGEVAGRRRQGSAGRQPGDDRRRHRGGRRHRGDHVSAGAAPRHGRRALRVAVRRGSCSSVVRSAATSRRHQERVVRDVHEADVQRGSNAGAGVEVGQVETHVAVVVERLEAMSLRSMAGCHGDQNTMVAKVIANLS